MRTEERVKTINDIINGIAIRSSYKFKRMSVEDIAHDLWIRVLEKEKEEKRDLDLDLIASICFDHIIDLKRREIVRDHDNIDCTFESKEYNPASQSFSYSRIAHSEYEPPENIDKLLLLDLINLFPKNSKERLFLEYWSTSSGFKDFGIIGDGKSNGGYTESDLAKKLGYYGTGSGGFKIFRNRMRAIVIRYIHN